ncbi:hypothetical protein FNH09_26735 [Streptomyces adustus]|uniref:Uncharacterized protein n=1 Tax=Streptomyces adustus TaxID=1609272 RepID=A0A5N8VHK3_9ACTN|nr:hypothetical protein [Streptomyces adustus]MPY34703.1 hypothetical protein [Streptomyces adustus]
MLPDVSDARSEGQVAIDGRRRGLPKSSTLSPADFIGPCESQGSAEFKSHYCSGGGDVFARDCPFPASSRAAAGVKRRKWSVGRSEAAPGDVKASLTNESRKGILDM